MRALDEKLLNRFLDLAAKRLEGEWVLLGGTVLPLLGHDYRSTTDIDFVPTSETSTAETLKIMRICDELDLPIETVNGAAQFFLQKIRGFRENLILVREGRAKVFRPKVLLFLQLKMGRLSKSDLSDCLEMLKIAPDDFTEREKKVFLAQLKRETEKASDEKKKRLEILKEAVQSHPGSQR